MSDGPHRSLPMRRHWRDFAERSAKAAFSPDQVSEALPHALKKEILEAPIKEIRDIMGSGSLFPEMRIERLEALRKVHRGSAAATRVIDCAIEAAASGLIGEGGTHMAVKNAIDDTARDALRGVPSRVVLELGDASPGSIRLSDHAARSMI